MVSSVLLVLQEIRSTSFKKMRKCSRAVVYYTDDKGRKCGVVHTKKRREFAQAVVLLH